jgi:hypothetical protein
MTKTEDLLCHEVDQYTMWHLFVLAQEQVHLLEMINVYQLSFLDILLMSSPMIQTKNQISIKLKIHRFIHLTDSCDVISIPLLLSSPDGVVGVDLCRKQIAMALYRFYTDSYNLRYKFSICYWKKSLFIISNLTK